MHFDISRKTSERFNVQIEARDRSSIVPPHYTSVMFIDLSGTERRAALNIKSMFLIRVELGDWDRAPPTSHLYCVVRFANNLSSLSYV